MMKEKLNVLSSYALAMTVALLAVAMSGCNRQDEVYPLEGNAYMNDPEFIAQLEGRNKVRDDLRKTTLKSQGELNVLVKTLGSLAAATNTKRGAELYAKIMWCEEQFVTNRMEVMRITRERIKRAIEDSKRIQRGEAKAIGISKKETK